MLVTEFDRGRACHIVDLARKEGHNRGDHVAAIIHVAAELDLDHDELVDNFKRIMDMALDGYLSIYMPQDAWDAILASFRANLRRVSLVKKP
jgi:hypothetical protein